LEVEIIVSTELRTLVLEAIKARATMTDSSCGLSDDIRLAQIGIDSLGLILIFIDLSTQTGLLFERQEGFPITTVGQVIQFALDLSQQQALK
jgi:acyl carrier protein